MSCALYVAQTTSQIPGELSRFEYLLDCAFTVSMLALGWYAYDFASFPDIYHPLPSSRIPYDKARVDSQSCIPSWLL